MTYIIFYSVEHGNSCNLSVFPIFDNIATTEYDLTGISLLDSDVRPNILMIYYCWSIELILGSKYY